MARLYTNENFPFPVAQALRQLGHDVLTIQETGRAGEGMPDQEVLGFAMREARAMLTLNRADFIKLHRATPDHCGIIVCTVDEDFVRLASRIHAAISDPTTLAGQLIRVNRPQ